MRKLTTKETMLIGGGKKWLYGYWCDDCGRYLSVISWRSCESIHKRAFGHKHYSWGWSYGDY